jgi:cytochrome b
MRTTPPPGEGEVAMARVWDIPTRAIHWTMAALIPALWWTAEEGLMDWHRRAGSLMLGLLVFRVLWGLLGSSTARFAGFIRGPATVWRYAQGLLGRSGGEAFHGHNPMGGWSVAAMLALLVAQVTLGLFAVDVDGLEGGPLSIHVSFDAGRTAAALHETVFNLLLILIALHVVAVLGYLLLKRENLVGAMIHGRRPGRSEDASMRPAPYWRSAVVAAIAAGAAWWIYKGAPFQLPGAW